MSDETKFPAPALARGIRILQALNEADGALTLEKLAQAVVSPVCQNLSSGRLVVSAPLSK